MKIILITFIQKYIKKNFICDNNKSWFLSLINPVITEEDNDILKHVITLDELCDIIFSMDINKSPGIDGIPVEFYHTYWDIIKHEICEVINKALNSENLSETHGGLLFYFVWTLR